MSEKGAGLLKKVFSKKQRSQDDSVANFHTTIIRVEDNFISTSSIMLDQQLTGNIYSMKEAIINPGSDLFGSITSQTALVGGRVRGDIICMDCARILKSAVVSGDIRARSISVEPGAVINGSVKIDPDIDDSDLLEKMKQRLPVSVKTEPDPAVLPQETIPAKSDLRPSESGKKNQPKRTKPPESLPENPVSPGGGWY